VVDIFGTSGVDGIAELVVEVQVDLAEMDCAASLPSSSCPFPLFAENCEGMAPPGMYWSVSWNSDLADCGPGYTVDVCCDGGGQYVDIICCQISVLVMEVGVGIVGICWNVSCADTPRWSVGIGVGPVDF